MKRTEIILILVAIIIVITMIIFGISMKAERPEKPVISEPGPTVRIGEREYSLIPHQVGNETVLFVESTVECTDLAIFQEDECIVWANRYNMSYTSSVENCELLIDDFHVGLCKAHVTKDFSHCAIIEEYGEDLTPWCELVAQDLDCDKIAHTCERFKEGHFIANFVYAACKTVRQDCSNTLIFGGQTCAVCKQ